MSKSSDQPGEIPADLVQAVLVASADFSDQPAIRGYDFRECCLPSGVEPSVSPTRPVSTPTTAGSSSPTTTSSEAASPTTPPAGSSPSASAPLCVVDGSSAPQQKVDYRALLESYALSGFQATNYGLAVSEIRKMLNWRLAHEPVAEDEDEAFLSEEARQNVRCKIFLAYTSNLISAGMRETLRFLFEHKLIQVAVTSAGGIEEDIIKCLAKTYRGEFSLDGVALRKRGKRKVVVRNSFHGEQSAVHSSRTTPQYVRYFVWQGCRVLGLTLENDSNFFRGGGLGDRGARYGSWADGAAAYGGCRVE